VEVSDINNGTFIVRLINISGGALAQAVSFNFAIINGSAT
jgi:hypothetical protein